ncbi:MerR family transcriptional regulator [Neobacillus sp. PS3-40]|uniref:MerR family transcriptional regulator n=1 Tax=Neobacillus sp. PS3-40 TaxID=3070679 RepID=UPI0027E1512C|nr:MerR family transcriptional regulator [Neobacillus sp. PS3-40]WML44816.1 MerR family transcriptional regulator [Neobacillus sp. PS3-40]
MLKTHTIKEVSKKINVPLGTIKKWENELSEFLKIPRTKGGARVYTNSEIELLLKMKPMRTKNQRIEMVRDFLNEQSLDIEPQETSIAILSEPDSPPSIVEEAPLMNVESFFNAMEIYKQNVIQEVKEEIRSVVRKEIVDEVKKEISKGSVQTMKYVSDAIYKSSENTKCEIQDLSNAVYKVEEQTRETADTLSDKIIEASKGTSEDLATLSNSIGLASKGTSKEIYTLEKTITNISRGTSDQIATLSRQLSNSADNLNHYLDETNNDIFGLTEALASDRANFNKGQEQLRAEILQRELAFQEMLANHRDAAVSKEKKWWQIW